MFAVGERSWRRDRPAYCAANPAALIATDHLLIDGARKIAGAIAARR